ncbi:MAG: hypothetical protein ASARMPREDX12_005161 [Alectoria sarmentosa]|nr:MAG: hypothetical protein ASARMPREDX12_005161 [Alectoria sarmentosa]
MALITGIPTELIHEILSYIQLEDLENFAQISKKIYTVAVPFLSEHRALCRKYSTFTSDQAPSSLITRSEFLKRVLGDPSVGRYVKTIKLLGKQDDDDVPYQGQELLKEDQQLLGQLAREIGFFKWILTAGAPNTHLSPFVFFAEPLILILLLLRFRNATSIHVEAGFVDHHHQKAVFYEFLREMASHPSPALSNLTKISLRPSPMQASSIAEAQIFCALPSVKFFSAPDLGGSESVEVGLTMLNTANLPSTITQLELWNCAARPECLYEFLRGFTRLQNFKYSFADPAKFPPIKAPHFNPFMIRNGLISHSATTLRKMVLLAHPNDHAPPFMGSLREFSALTELRTTYSCLAGTDCYHQLLSQILPHSLRRLVLDGQKSSMSDEAHYYRDPVRFTVGAAVDAKAGAGRGLLRTVPIEELVFTGYEGFASDEDKELALGRAEDVAIAVKFLAIDELDQTFMASSH